MSHERCQRSPGVLPLLQAFVRDERRFDATTLDDTAFETALRGGAGPILAYASAHSPTRGRLPRENEIQAADLTMRMMTGEMLRCLEQILGAVRGEGVEVTLLKGSASALRYYPEPHLRTMGDVDLLVSDAQREPLERQLRALGFAQPGDPREALVRDHHHSLPFKHLSKGLYFEVHTRPYPSHSPLTRMAAFSYEAVTSRSESIAVGSQSAWVLNHEQQLVYTATRWAEMINAERGMFPLLDAALLLRSRGDRLDWDAVCRLSDEPWAAGAVALMLTYLDRRHLAQVPGAVLSRLANRDGVTNAIVRRLLHRLVNAYVMEGRRTGAILSRSNRRLIWSTLSAAKSPWAKLLELPINLVFPPTEKGRFGPAVVMRRVRTAVKAVRRSA
jgi:hypothetical protein